MTEWKLKKKRSVFFYVLFGLLYLTGVVFLVLLKWFLSIYNVTFESLFFTLNLPLGGTDGTIIKTIIGVCIPPALLTICLYSIWVLIDSQRCYSVAFSGRVFGKSFDRVFLHPGRRIVPLAGAAVFILAIALAVIQLDMPAYFKARLSTTTIYEDYYVDPMDANIRAEGKTKNLIYICMESMETCYSSTDDGGEQDIDYIPFLTELARNNVSFSNTEKLGGFFSPCGTEWTMGGLFASAAVIPFSFPVGQNDMEYFDSFAPNLTTMGDMLNAIGYRQEFLCGSNSRFAGRRTFYTQHGDFEIFDLYTARAEKYIPEGYMWYWGFEDFTLYEIAKDELTELAKGDEPFNFIMLTQDTHFPAGFICDKCGETYDNRLANVLTCADGQIEEFIAWLQQQDFYEDSVVVIVGDHPRMDTELVSDADPNHRTVYNCFLNVEGGTECSTENRIFTTMDLFPTVLSAMGFEIEDDRLGLGTNMFSDKQTLAEELGYEYLNGELAKYSEYYLEAFS